MLAGGRYVCAHLTDMMWHRDDSIVRINLRQFKVMITTRREHSADKFVRTLNIKRPSLFWFSFYGKRTFCSLNRFFFSLHALIAATNWTWGCFKRPHKKLKCFPFSMQISRNELMALLYRLPFSPHLRSHHRLISDFYFQSNKCKRYVGYVISRTLTLGYFPTEICYISHLLAWRKKSAHI